MGVLTWLWVACGSVGEPVVHVERTAQVVKPAVRDPRWTAARCNDGSPFAFSLRTGSPDVWVINLTGGYFCDDERAPCANRKRRLTTTLPVADSEPWPRMKRTGIFDLDPAANPTFATATHVDAHYCSSDLWLGTSTERQATTGDRDGGWYFSGRHNVAALFENLAAEHGLDDDDPRTRVLWLGTSAGGAGVVGNLDTVRQLLPKTAAAGRLKVLLDASWVPEQPVGTPLPNAARWGPVHPQCHADAISAGTEPRLCIYGERWWPYVAATSVPVMVQLSGMDTSQTPVFGVGGPEAQRTWRARTRKSLQRLPWVYSGGQAYHVSVIEPRFGKGPRGRTLADVVARFWAGADPERVLIGYDEPR